MGPVFQRDETVLGAAVGADEFAMLSIEAERYFSTGTVGKRLWELLSQPRSIADLCSIICNEFDVDERTSDADVRSFVDELIQHKLIQVAETR